MKLDHKMANRIIKLQLSFYEQKPGEFRLNFTYVLESPQL